MNNLQADVRLKRAVSWVDLGPVVIAVHVGTSLVERQQWAATLAKRLGVPFEAKSNLEAGKNDAP